MTVQPSALASARPEGQTVTFLVTVQPSGFTVTKACTQAAFPAAWRPQASGSRCKSSVVYTPFRSALNVCHWHTAPSRDSGGLNCNLFFIIIQFFSFLHAFLIQCNASLSQKHACGPQFGSLCAFSQKMLQSFYIFRIGDTCKI